MFFEERVKNKKSFWVSNEVVPFWANRIKGDKFLDLGFEVIFDGPLDFIGFPINLETTWSPVLVVVVSVSSLTNWIFLSGTPAQVWDIWAKSRCSMGLYFE